MPELREVLRLEGLRKSYNIGQPNEVEVLHGLDLRLDSADPAVPHPRMGERAFVLLPLAELAPPLVDAQQLAAVAGQRMECVAPAQQWLQN